MLLAGDIETYAQADLGHLRADVLKVPHHGAGTSDPDWLEGVGAEIAVISVVRTTSAIPSLGSWPSSKRAARACCGRIWRVMSSCRSVEDGRLGPWISE